MHSATMTDAFAMLAVPEQLSRLNAIFAADAARAVQRLKLSDYDQAIELFFAPTTPTTWVPTDEQLKAVAKLGFANVYCDFADDTEFIGCWRLRVIDGKKQGEYWVMSPRRERVGYPRYNAG
jgi:hypothetical protein